MQNCIFELIGETCSLKIIEGVSGNRQLEIDFIRLLVYNFEYNIASLIRTCKGKIYGIFIIETNG